MLSTIKSAVEPVVYTRRWNGKDAIGLKLQDGMAGSFIERRPRVDKRPRNALNRVSSEFEERETEARSRRIRTKEADRVWTR